MARRTCTAVSSAPSEGERAHGILVHRGFDAPCPGPYSVSIWAIVPASSRTNLLCTDATGQHRVGSVIIKPAGTNFPLLSHLLTQRQPGSSKAVRYLLA